MPAENGEAPLTHPRPHDLDGHTLNHQVPGADWQALAIGAPEHGPAALYRPHPQDAGTIDQGRHDVALARLHAVLADCHVTGEEGDGRLSIPPILGSGFGRMEAAE